MHVPYDWRCRTNPLGSYEHELGHSDGVRESLRGEMFFLGTEEVTNTLQLTAELVRRF